MKQLKVGDVTGINESANPSIVWKCVNVANISDFLREDGSCAPHWKAHHKNETYGNTCPMGTLVVSIETAHEIVTNYLAILEYLQIANDNFENIGVIENDVWTWENNDKVNDLTDILQVEIYLGTEELSDEQKAAVTRLEEKINAALKTLCEIDSDYHDIFGCR